MELHPGLVRPEVYSILEALLKRRNTELLGPLQGFWKKLLQVRSSQLMLHWFPGVLVSVVKRNRTNIIYVYVCIYVYNIHTYIICLKELTHRIMEVGNFKICREGLVAWNPGKSQYCS